MNKHGQYVHKSEQKVTVCIRDGRISYETDSDAIRSASEEVADALADLEKYNLQSQIDDLNDQMEDLADAYQDQLDFLDEQIEKWEKISEFAENTQNALVADQYLGEDWVMKVITGDDEDIFESFKELYMQNSEQIAQYEKQITTTENINALLEQYITAYEEETITYEQALTGIQNLLDQMNSDMTTGQNLQNVLDYLATVNDTEATVEDVLVGLQDSLTEYSEELIKAIELNYANGEAIADVRTSWDILTDNVSEIRDYAEEILDAIEDLDFSSYYRYYDDDDDDSSSGTSSHTNSTSGNVYVDSVKGDIVYSDSVKEHYESSQSGPGVYAEGLEKGIIGDDKEAANAIMTLGTTDIDDNAVPIVAHKGEMVINPEQQTQLLKNISSIANPLANLQAAPILPVVRDNNADIDIQFGDIVLPDVTDPDGFANAMGTQIESALRQAVSSIRI